MNEYWEHGLHKMHNKQISRRNGLHFILFFFLQIFGRSQLLIRGRYFAVTVGAAPILHEFDFIVASVCSPNASLMGYRYNAYFLHNTLRHSRR